MADFKRENAIDYDSRIERLVPGYHLLQEILPPLLASYLSGEARILVAGAGTCREILAMAALRPSWRFVAVDPSDAMLDVGEKHVKGRGISHRVTFRASLLADFQNSSRFDAAVSLLVMHFLPDDGVKAAYLADIGRHLKANAPFIFADLTAFPLDETFCAYRHWARVRNQSDEECTAMFARIRANFHPINRRRLRHLLSDAGFTEPEPFFQALGYRGYMTHRY